jgi:uncharacterized protein (DUF433 family)
VTFTRITLDPAQMGGIRLRIPVAAVVGMVADGMAEAEILSAYPDLVREDIQESLRYAAEAVRERELPLAVPVLWPLRSQQQLLSALMPTISQFFGISIRLYYTDHPPPHIHVLYQDFEAKLAIDTGDVTEGRLPKPVLRMARDWARQHR